MQAFWLLCCCSDLARQTTPPPIVPTCNSTALLKVGSDTECYRVYWTFFSLLSLFSNNKRRLMRSPSCLCVSPYPLLNVWTNLYETWYVYHDTWTHMSGVLHKSFPSVCVSICVSPLSLLGNGSVNTSSRQRIHPITEELCGPCRIKGGSVGLCILPIVVRQWLGKHVLAAKNCWRHRFSAVPVISKESRRLVLLRTSCFITYTTHLQAMVMFGIVYWLSDSRPLRLMSRRPFC
jgi:hypothetical protein